MSLAILTSYIRGLQGLRDASYDSVLGMVSARLIDTSGDYSHIVKRKSRGQLILLSCAVCGIEFCYAAETAFVSPILLQIGVPVLYMTMVWCLSPLLGFVLVPLLGSLSDKCRFKLGRRRPFILFLSVGIILGLILVPNGERIGTVLGMPRHVITNNSSDWMQDNVTSYSTINEVTTSSDFVGNVSEWISMTTETPVYVTKPQIGGILITILGVVLLDFCCDACQSPCRAYLLDVSVPEDHPVGLSTFTVMAGLGGSLGYVMGGINWNETSFGESLGGHTRVVFTMVLLIYLVCVTLTVCSIKEVPLDKLGVGEAMFQKKKIKVGRQKYRKFSNEDDDDDDDVESGQVVADYGATNVSTVNDNTNRDTSTEVDSVRKPTREGSGNELKKDNTSDAPSLPLPSEISLKTYLLSIVRMPRSMVTLCVTNLFCWMSLVCYSLYFTDFVGQAVYHGDPSSSPGSRERELYESGVRLGSFSMSLYSISCSVYSLSIELLVRKCGARVVYITSQLVYTLGAAMMVALPHPVAVMLLSPCAGVMYATLFTMPYLLVAHYHSTQQFHSGEEMSRGEQEAQVRGLGTDIAVVSSMVFIAQFLLSAVIGPLVHVVRSTKVVMACAAVLSACGAISATKVMYLDL